MVEGVEGLAEEVGVVEGRRSAQDGLEVGGGRGGREEGEVAEEGILRADRRSDVDLSSLGAETARVVENARERGRARHCVVRSREAVAREANLAARRSSIVL